MISPKISVVIPSYNKGKYIDNTLDSIFSQKYPNLEVIIQDGGSTDESHRIIKKYLKKYPKNIKYVSKKDKGQLDAINQGIARATGEIVCFINADDVYTNVAFKNVAKTYAKYPNAPWFVGKGIVINKKGEEIAGIATQYKNILLNINHRFLLLTTNYLVQPSVFLTKKAYKKYGPFIGTDDFVMEYDLWLKLSRIQMPVVIRSNLSKFRLTEDTITSNMFADLLAEDEKIIRKYTKNTFILILHKLNNWGRLIFEKLI